MNSVLAEMWTWLGREIERHARLQALARLDDHLLADIGLRRDQLESLVLLTADEPRDLGRRLERGPAGGPVLQGCG